MQIVIDISEEIRIAITRMGLLRISEDMIKVVDKAIQNGTPLPKGHGALIDKNNIKEIKLEDSLDNLSWQTWKEWHEIDEIDKRGERWHMIDDYGVECEIAAPIIIKADEDGI